jgi:glutaredoxin
MKTLRSILGKLILVLDRSFSPKALVRSAESQAKVDAETAKLALYQFETCPFCVKVRRTIQRLGLKIELRDAKDDSKWPKWKEELVREGGEYQVPCLRIPEADGSVRWMYESSDIVSYLEARFAPPGGAA